MVKIKKRFDMLLVEQLQRLATLLEEQICVRC